MWKRSQLTSVPLYFFISSFLPTLYPGSSCFLTRFPFIPFLLQDSAPLLAAVRGKSLWWHSQRDLTLYNIKGHVWEGQRDATQLLDVRKHYQRVKFNIILSMCFIFQSKLCPPHRSVLQMVTNQMYLGFQCFYLINPYYLLFSFHSSPHFYHHLLVSKSREKTVA